MLKIAGMLGWLKQRRWLFWKKPHQPEPKININALILRAQETLGKRIGSTKCTVTEIILELEEAMESYPRHVLLRCYLGFALTCEGRIDEAIEILKKAVEIDPRRILAMCYLARTLIMDGQYIKAIAELKTAFNIDQTSSSVAYYLADVYFRMGNAFQEAKEWAKKALEFMPEHRNAARILDEINKIENQG